MFKAFAQPLETGRATAAGVVRVRHVPVRLIRSPSLSTVAEYAYTATVEPPAQVVFAAGACPLDADGATVGVGDYAAQARQSMLNLQVALTDAGAKLSDVAKTTVYVASSKQADLVTAWAVVRDFFGDHDPPSTLLGVACLGYTDQLVEVEAVAAISR
jgi:enamine deaminase RidA (YjgF/YER057c/UK114 family)